MTRKERYEYILDYFKKNEGHKTTELNFASPFQLLCATLLSAQCTDKRINEVTPNSSGTILTQRQWRLRNLRTYLNMSIPSVIPIPSLGT